MINPKLLNWDELGMVHCWIYYMIQPGMSSLGNAKLGPPHKIPSDGNIETPYIPTAKIYIYIHVHMIYDVYIYIYFFSLNPMKLVKLEELSHNYVT